VGESLAMIGKTLGHYQIASQLGKGGMGEVYLADDLNLNRKVALKFLPDAFAGDPERMARFEREARLLASLNHPNIAAIYGLEKADGKPFLVLELVEGETLAQRISKSALPIEEALAICRQIAEGLEAAHEKGVIHRDLKPANVMITEGDKVKILDFGLAKAFSDESQIVDSSQSPTLTEAMTRPGFILGTAAYMSPEQAKGKSVDKRADIWAFGCILYECLTGKRAFGGETATETLAAVLRAEPEWHELPQSTPQSIRFALSRCLEKDLNRRFRDAADVSIQLENSDAIDQVAAPAKHTWPAWTWTAIASLIVMALAVTAFLYFRGMAPTKAMRFQLAAPPMPDEYSLAVSPDGRWIAYVAAASGPIPSIFIQEVGSVTPRQIEGTEGAEYPFWSPDSRSVGFCAGGKLKRAGVSGGSLREICTVASSFVGGTWSNDDVILFSDWPNLRRVSAEGGESTPITNVDLTREVTNFGFPQFFPDGRYYLYLANSGRIMKSDLYLGLLDSTKQTRILTGISKAVYAEPGHLLFQREGTLFAQPFDTKKLTLSGRAVSIADSLLAGIRSGASFSASAIGPLVYRAASVQTGSQFVWLDRLGHQLSLAGDPANYLPSFDLSPDGQQIAVERVDPATSNADIWVLQWSRNVSKRITFDPAEDDNVVWSPDGLRLGFTSKRKGNADIFEKRVSGVAPETPIVDSAGHEWMEDWSRDGRYIISTFGLGDDADLYAIPLFGERKPFAIVQSPFAQDEPHLSVDGRWLAYNSIESGAWQVYIVSFPAADQQISISTNGGAQPRWRRDGKELYYLALDGKMMAVDIKGDAKIEPGVPHMLFDTRLNVDPIRDQYAVTPDGQRFLILKPLEEPATTPITLVLNWTSLIKK
jgi:eukaryotic-like serine/threonine-protein kinase